MKIGIDAHLLAKRLTGIGYYILEVIKELKKLDVHITLFSPAPLLVSADILEGIVVVTGSNSNAIARFIWNETQLPFLLKNHRLDIFWGAAHRLPAFIPRYQVTALTIHDLVWRKVPETMRLRTKIQEALFMPRSLRRADIILTNSTSTGSDLLDYQPTLKDKISCVSEGCGNGALQSGDDKPPLSSDPLSFLWSSRLNKPYVLFTGTLEPRKNLLRLLAGFKALPENLRQEFQLVVAGGRGWGGIDRRIREEIRKYELNEKVIVIGYASEQELSCLYRSAYCLAMPSLYEGFGMPILEAHAFGVPVVTSNISSMPEIVGDAGILVDPLDVESISHGLRILLENKILRKELSCKAIKNAKKYSWKRTAQLVLEAFKKVIDLKN